MRFEIQLQSDPMQDRWPWRIPDITYYTHISYYIIHIFFHIAHYTYAYTSYHILQVCVILLLAFENFTLHAFIFHISYVIVIFRMTYFTFHTADAYAHSRKVEVELEGVLLKKAELSKRFTGPWETKDFQVLCSIRIAEMFKYR